MGRVALPADAAFRHVRALAASLEPAGGSHRQEPTGAALRRPFERLYRRLSALLRG